MPISKNWDSSSNPSMPCSISITPVRSRATVLRKLENSSNRGNSIRRFCKVDFCHGQICLVNLKFLVFKRSMTWLLRKSCWCNTRIRTSLMDRVQLSRLFLFSNYYSAYKSSNYCMGPTMVPRAPNLFGCKMYEVAGVGLYKYYLHERKNTKDQSKLENDCHYMPTLAR